MDLHYGSISPKEGRLLNVHYLVDFESDIEFIKKEGMKMLLETGVKYIGIAGNQSKLWYENFIKVSETLGIKNVAEKFGIVKQFDNTDEFFEDVKNDMHIRYFVPTDIYIISDNPDTETTVSDLL